MKRIVLAAVVLIGLLTWGLFRPQYVTALNLSITANIGLIILIATLVFMPVTKFVEVEKLREHQPPSLAFSLNGLRGVLATFHFQPGTGETITGKLVARHTSRGTIGIEVEKNDTKMIVTVLVADMSRLEVEESNWRTAKTLTEEYSEEK